MAFQKLSESRYEYAQIFRRGTLEVEIYKPVIIDKQQPHKKDELYVIISGKSMFIHEEKVSEVSAGDCLFVPAHDEHRFFDFSEDFTTWVFFFGPEGGETL